ncbi:9640_t:CDS:2 [Gigaspora rosea]|nr:9640_t:CDS:2 [Gigaspora rosea]
MRSSVNFLGTSTSDVDICVTTPNKELENILTLSEKLQKHEMKVVKCIPKAKVPIVKFWNPTLMQNPIIIYLDMYDFEFPSNALSSNLPVLKINEKENENELLEVEYKNNESIGKCLNKWEKNWMHWKLCVEEPFNPERNLGNGVNNDRFKKIIQEFRRAVEYLHIANLELCCKIYDEYEYDEFEYVARILLITLKALRKANLDSKKNEFE